MNCTGQIININVRTCAAPHVLALHGMHGAYSFLAHMSKRQLIYSNLEQLNLRKMAYLSSDPNIEIC
jgi:hypothetical protein